MSEEDINRQRASVGLSGKRKEPAEPMAYTVSGGKPDVSGRALVGDRFRDVAQPKVGSTKLSAQTFSASPAATMGLGRFFKAKAAGEVEGSLTWIQKQRGLVLGGEKPAAVTPAKPAAVTPAKPAAVTPAKPAAVTPAKPAVAPVDATAVENPLGRGDYAQIEGYSTDVPSFELGRGDYAQALEDYSVLGAGADIFRKPLAGAVSAITAASDTNKTITKPLLAEEVSALNAARAFSSEMSKLQLGY